jgi:adenylate cyclase
MPEIERKFLVRELPPEAREGRAEEIEQGYLVAGPTEVRIRRSAGVSQELTVKSGSGLRRVEVTLPLTSEQFSELWPVVRCSLEKRRTTFALGPWNVEVDVYRGKLDGLVVAEVEFGTEAEAHAFGPPAWFGAEVTGDERFRNSALAAADRPPEIILPA